MVRWFRCEICSCVEMIAQETRNCCAITGLSACRYLHNRYMQREGLHTERHVVRMTVAGERKVVFASISI